MVVGLLAQTQRRRCTGRVLSLNGVASCVAPRTQSLVALGDARAIMRELKLSESVESFGCCGRRPVFGKESSPLVPPPSTLRSRVQLHSTVVRLCAAFSLCTTGLDCALALIFSSLAVLRGAYRLSLAPCLQRNSSHI